MSGLTDALRWSGDTYTVSVFAVAGAPLPAEIFSELAPGGSVQHYELEDGDKILAGEEVHEYDIELDGLPPDLGTFLAETLRLACARGARLAWLGFEGSFHHDHLLTEDVADQIYGICAHGGEPALALDDAVRTGRAWRENLTTQRRELRKPG